MSVLDGRAQEGGGSSLVCAVLENRAREVGFAVFDSDDPHLRLSQFVDGHAYPNLLTLLEAHSPGVRRGRAGLSSSSLSLLLFRARLALAAISRYIVIARLRLVAGTILLCAGAQKLGSTDVIDLFWGERATVAYAARSAFDDTKGGALVRQVALGDNSAAAGPFESFYLAYGAAGALLSFLSSSDLALLPGTVPVAYEVRACDLLLLTRTAFSAVHSKLFLQQSCHA